MSFLLCIHGLLTMAMAKPNGDSNVDLSTPSACRAEGGGASTSKPQPASCMATVTGCEAGNNQKGRKYCGREQSRYLSRPTAHGARSSTGPAARASVGPGEGGKSEGIFVHTLFTPDGRRASNGRWVLWRVAIFGTATFSNTGNFRNSFRRYCLLADRRESGRWGFSNSVLSSSLPWRRELSLLIWD